MNYRKPPILEVYAETVVVPNENVCAFNRGTVEDFFAQASPFVIKEGKFQNSLDITHDQRGQVRDFKYNLDFCKLRNELDLPRSQSDNGGM